MAIERQSLTWKAIEAHCREKLSAKGAELERSGIDLASTENIRGEISALRQILALAAPLKFEVPAQDNYGMGDP